MVGWWGCWICSGCFGGEDNKGKIEINENESDALTKENACSFGSSANDNYSSHSKIQNGPSTEDHDVAILHRLLSSNASNPSSVRSKSETLCSPQSSSTPLPTTPPHYPYKRLSLPLQNIVMTVIPKNLFKSLSTTQNTPLSSTQNNSVIIT